jgi:hypothetical protein
MQFINVNIGAWVNSDTDYQGNALDPIYADAYRHHLAAHLTSDNFNDEASFFSILFTAPQFGLNSQMPNDVNNNWLNGIREEEIRIRNYSLGDDNATLRMNHNTFSARDLHTPWQRLEETFGKRVVFWLGKIPGVAGWVGIPLDASRESWAKFNTLIYNTYSGYTSPPFEDGDEFIYRGDKARFQKALVIKVVREMSITSGDFIFSDYATSQSLMSSVSEIAMQSALDNIHMEVERVEQERLRIDRAPHVAAYHQGASERSSYVSKDTLFSIGFEVEKEDADAKESINYINFKNATGWDKERDGSLNSDGYEIISPTYDLYDERLDRDLENDVLRNHVDAEYSRRCGGHIHLGAVGMSGRTFFDRMSPWIPLMYSLYVGRINGEHCKIKLNNDIKHSDDKYQSVRVLSNRIELRIPNAVEDSSNLLWRRDLMRIICDNLDATPLRVVSMMTDKRSRAYKHLRKVYSESRMQVKLQLYVYFANELLSNEYTMIPERIPSWEKMFSKSQIEHLREYNFRQKSITI